MKEQELVPSHNNPDILYDMYHILFVERTGYDKNKKPLYTPKGRAWAKRQHIRFRVGWEIKDCFDKAVPVDEYRFALVEDIIKKGPVCIFIIKR